MRWDPLGTHSEPLQTRWEPLETHWDPLGLKHNFIYVFQEHASYFLWDSNTISYVVFKHPPDISFGTKQNSFFCVFQKHCRCFLLGLKTNSYVSVAILAQVI